MKVDLKKYVPVTFLICFSIIVPAHAKNAVSERIYFIQQDGRHALIYTTSRSDFSSYGLWFDKKKDYKSEDYLQDFHYLFPETGKWTSKENDKYRVLKLPKGDFASLKWVDLQRKDRLVMDEDGSYYYRNWNSDKERKTSAGHFGMWNSPGNFERVACSWVFPDNLEPVNHIANRDGEWVRRHNTLTYYGQNVNDLMFTIHYRPKSSDAYQDLKELEKEGVEVEQQSTGVKMTVAETLLFPSGIAAISENGKNLLNKLALNLDRRESMNVVVAGHTDNVPISQQLVERFPTNWELSSQRAINIIHHLIDQGIEEARFEAQAFSFMQPVASNDSEDGRSKNRRIEIMLVDKEYDRD